ncbi:hypothetical protein U9M48_007476, partial [Paspalum notatum var. saurae]
RFFGPASLGCGLIGLPFCEEEEGISQGGEDVAAARRQGGVGGIHHGGRRRQHQQVDIHPAHRHRRLAKKYRAVEVVEVRGPRRPEGGETRKGSAQQPQEKAKAKRPVRWKCASGCGACCKLDKGPDFPTPDEIFADHPDDLQLYRSMIGADGWCINYDKATRTCNIYQDRPSFCRVEPKVFDEFFGVPPSRFDREACSACLDNIKMVYGDDSTELSNFKRLIREESNKLQASQNQDK